MPKKRLTRLVAVATLAILTLFDSGLASASTHPRSAKQHPEKSRNAPVVHKLSKSSAAVKKFWTEERMHAAKPMRAPRGNGHGPRPAPPDSPVRPLSIRGVAASDLPRSDGPETPAGSRARVWPEHNSMPASTVGKLYSVLHLPDGEIALAYCTATVVTASNESTLWTAGHCVNTGGPLRPQPIPGVPAGTWFDEFLFAPDHSSSGDPHGVWTANRAITPSGWVNGGLRSYDVAALVLNPNGNERIAETTGSQGIRFSGPRALGVNVYAFGYPFSLDPPGVDLANPEELRYCTGTTFPSISFAPVSLRCNMLTGASGGPWISDLRFGRGWGYIIGDTSQQLSPGVMTSPFLGLAALNTYNAAEDA